MVDNASVDGLQKIIKKDFPEVILIESDTNLGFGKANNLGAKKAKGEYLFFLNSDCILIENTIKAFFEFMEQHNSTGNIGAVGALLLDKNII